MQPIAGAEKDRAAAVEAAQGGSLPWRVNSVTPLANHRLLVSFIDGLSGTVDLSALVASPRAGVFARLRAIEVFIQVRVEPGAVTWPDDLDLAPDAMHAAIRKTGEWVL